MHIYIDNGTSSMPELDLPFDFWPELSRTNPFLTEEGSQSIPLTLPASEHNMKLINFSYRGTSTKRPLSTTDAILSEGTNWIRGTLYINQINKEEGIECTFYTNEGQLYEKIKDYKIRELDWPIINGSGNSNEEKARDLMKTFLNVIQKESSGTKEYMIGNIWTEDNFIKNKNITFKNYLLLNELKFENDTLSFYAQNEQKYYTEAGENATEITAPVGFGITPFLKIGYVLRHIFQYFGYTLNPNAFDTNADLYRLVILNNVVDAIVDGNIHFKQLVPDITVEDFINAVRRKFCCEFILKGKTIDLLFVKDILKSAPDTDLSKYIRKENTVNTVAPQAISIKLQTLTKAPEGYTVRNPAIYTKQFEQSLIHNSPSGFEEVSVEMIDKTPYIYVGRTAYIVEEDIEGFKTDIASIFLPEGEYQKTTLIIDGEVVSENNNSSLDLAFCFIDSKITTINYGQYKKKKSIPGRLYSNFVTLLVNSYTFYHLGPAQEFNNNIYEVLYKEKDDMLKYANTEVAYEAVLPSHLISTMDISTPKIIQGMKVLIERIDYVLGHPDLCQITARTLHQYPE